MLFVLFVFIEMLLQNDGKQQVTEFSLKHEFINLLLCRVWRSKAAANLYMLKSWKQHMFDI